MIEPNHFGIPPWKSPEDWFQVNFSFEHIGLRQWQKLQSAKKIADQIDNKLRAIDGDLEILCDTTCPSCVDICCKKATVWYDFTDLLYLYFSSARLPAGQISRKADLSCSHLTPTGCELNRIMRPFICTWYICPDQKDISSGQKLQNSIQNIQILRKQLEEEFICALG
ncbi:MAG: hypothetical protein ACN4GW_11830 [Desulforhopalus sp.]